MKKEISRVMQVKEGRKWLESSRTTDSLEIYTALATDLINKKLCQAEYIKSIKRYSNYDGTQTVIVTYDNFTRSVYVVKN